jgi:hypothetical protein
MLFPSGWLRASGRCRNGRDAVGNGLSLDHLYKGLRCMKNVHQLTRRRRAIGIKSNARGGNVRSSLGAVSQSCILLEFLQKRNRL